MQLKEILKKTNKILLYFKMLSMKTNKILQMFLRTFIVFLHHKQHKKIQTNASFNNFKKDFLLML